METVFPYALFIDLFRQMPCREELYFDQAHHHTKSQEVLAALIQGQLLAPAYKPRAPE